MNMVALVPWKISVSWIMQRLSCFLIQQQKATFIKITTILLQEKSLLKMSGSGRHGISKILISLESLYLTIGNSTDSCFPWSNRLLLFIFEEKSAKQPSLNHTLSDISNKNGVPWKRMPAGCQNVFKCFSFGDDHRTSCSIGGLYVYFPFVTQNIKRHGLTYCVVNCVPLKGV